MRRRKEKILFVDDEEHLVDLAKELLGSLGYQVTATRDSRHALMWFQANHTDVDLVITDLTMPRLPGPELARRMLQIRPELPIILSTGYSRSVGEAHVRAAGLHGLALKPFTRDEISQVITTVLGERRQHRDEAVARTWG